MKQEINYSRISKAAQDRIRKAGREQLYQEVSEMSWRVHEMIMERTGTTEKWLWQLERWEEQAMDILAAVQVARELYHYEIDKGKRPAKRRQDDNAKNARDTEA